MHIVNVTDLRRNIREVLAEVIRSKKPAVILQRSKPVAYLVDAETFERSRKLDEMDVLTQTRKESLDRMLQLRAKVAKRAGIKSDSTKLIRELREGLNRHE
ncbi:type II toxin-antitoxin system Phd/YefM family antitoxin [Calderihabitans maritimus]|uniref:Antitoxin n=1 Tax=Calderihabitans maritimus TaxID=1246530 RepID=A0A1Z5HTD1_9FIRM|nr:type II toxin-antitoxin system Phd/YefM family antitoxin [Calderihabitans maritimus]GAW92581.1 prevent-host-death family protein [Calderihabitans maritimus]